MTCRVLQSVWRPCQSWREQLYRQRSEVKQMVPTPGQRLYQGETFESQSLDRRLLQGHSSLASEFLQTNAITPHANCSLSSTIGTFLEISSRDCNFCLQLRREIDTCLSSRWIVPWFSEEHKIPQRCDCRQAPWRFWSLSLRCILYYRSNEEGDRSENEGKTG